MRSLLLLLGFLVLGFAWIAPLPALAERAFSGHMLMHMAVVAVAAPLFALGIAATSADPVKKLPAFFAAIPASMIELIIVWAWHAPMLHEAARHSTGGFVVEQCLFLLAGLWVWLSAFGGEPADRNRCGAGIVALLLTSMHMTLLGALLALTPRPLYAHAHKDHLMPLTALEDQHLGGAIMILVGGVSYLAGGLWLTLSLLRAKALDKEANVS
jgi:putative membrane protein